MKLNVNKWRQLLNQIQWPAINSTNWDEINELIKLFAIEFMNISDNFFSKLWENQENNLFARTSYWDWNTKQDKELDWCKSVYLNDELEEIRRVAWLFFELRERVIMKIENWDMRKKYPVDLDHMTSDVPYLSIQIAKFKNLKLSKREVMCMMVGWMLHDIERFDSSHMTTRLKQWDQKEPYLKYKERHQKHCWQIAYTFFLKDLLDKLQDNIKLSAKEKSLILKIISSHDVPESLIWRKYHKISDKEKSRIDNIALVVSLADKISLYLPDFTEAFLMSHTHEQLIEKMWEMYKQLSEEDRMIVGSIDKWEHSKYFEEMKKKYNFK